MRLEFVTLVIFGLMSSSLGYVIIEEEFATGKKLSQEEEILANQARADIAEAIEDNLVKMFATIIVSQNEDEGAKGLYPRQDEDGDGDFEVVTPNPNVLPQVAQILGAIFSGTLNITRIADGTVGLVPNFLRNQIMGLVKLLTGETINLNGLVSTTTTALPTPIKVEVTTPDVIFQGVEASTVATPVGVALTSTSVVRPAVAAVTVPGPTPPKKRVSIAPAEAVVPTSTEPQLVTSVNLGNNKMRYRVRNKTKRTTTVSPQKPAPVDDELERVERDLMDAAWALEPYEHREPRFYAELFNTVMKNVNMTQVTKAVPSIFKGATQAIVMLENLGIVDTLPGADVLGDLEDVVEGVVDTE